MQNTAIQIEQRRKANSQDIKSAHAHSNWTQDCYAPRKINNKALNEQTGPHPKVYSMLEMRKQVLTRPSTSLPCKKNIDITTVNVAEEASIDAEAVIFILKIDRRLGKCERHKAHLISVTTNTSINKMENFGLKQNKNRTQHTGLVTLDRPDLL